MLQDGATCKKCIPKTCAVVAQLINICNCLALATYQLLLDISVTESARLGENIAIFVFPRQINVTRLTSLTVRLAGNLAVCKTALESNNLISNSL